MRACMTASGGVMFIPDTIARKKCKVSYQALVEEQAEDKAAADAHKAKKLKNPFFGRRKPIPACDAKAA